MNAIVVRGARQHNLKNIDVVVPRNALVVITGPSGSGKSSLAFDTIYAEGQRRYVESLSAYARQFLDRLPKPDVDTIEGLAPAISVEQRTASRNPRSTVGTTTEVFDYLRLLYARVGTPHCPSCGKEIHAQTVQQMVDRALAYPEGTRLAVLAPIVRSRKGEFRKELLEHRKNGFVRVRVDGETKDLGDDLRLDKKKKHDIDLYIDRLSMKADVRQRLTESIELALSLADGLVRIAPADRPEVLLSERFACVDCGVSLPEITPALFSFNGPQGACPECSGLGEVFTFEADLAVPDESLSIQEGAIAPWGKPDKPYFRFMVYGLKKHVDVALDRPWKALSAKVRETILRGNDTYEGVLPGLARRLREYERRKREQGGSTEDALEYLEQEVGRFAKHRACPTCKGARLRPEALAVTLGGLSIAALAALPLRKTQDTLRGLVLDPQQTMIADRILREVQSRLVFLVDVGLDYLSLDRPASTLSGGESERIRLATQIGAGLVGVVYVLDEPSIGLHPRDNARLIQTLRALRDRGNTVIVVEHDAETMRAANHIIDMGPGAGREGGNIIATGAPEELEKNERSVTGAFLSGRRTIAVPRRRRPGNGKVVHVRDATTNNLSSVTVDFPLGSFVCVTGVSGSGKSSLVIDTLLARAREQVHRAKGSSYEVRSIDGLEQIDKVIAIDQSPIGRTPRSNPATYTGVFGSIRDVFASLPESRARGYKPGRFSFNVKGGRCEACHGDGLVRIEMHFLPDVYVQCDVCQGKRYNRETLEIRYRGLNIAEVLALDVASAVDVLGSIPSIRERLEALRAVGLGYVELGQSATTLSGGEAQRIKLARELARRATSSTLYVLDEPTTGLHFQDVELLLGVLQDLVDSGNTVIVIEHNLDVIKSADHVIDMGPEGGAGGGRVVATGTPEEIANAKASYTGQSLRSLL